MGKYRLWLARMSNNAMSNIQWGRLRRKRAIWKCALAVLFVIFPLRTCVDWIHPHPDHKAVRRFPNTERAYASMGSDEIVAISVSPDDRWLVFAEFSADFPELYNVDSGDWYRIASIDLQSGAKRTHHPPADLAEDIRLPDGYVGYGGAGNWVDGVFVLNRNGPRRKSLVLDPAQDELVWRLLDEAPMGCSDCMPVGASGNRANKRWSNCGSFAWRSAAEPVYYTSKGDDIVRILPDSRAETVISAGSKWRFGMVARMDLLRVSPDGRFLAYSVLRDLANLLPFIPGSGWTQYLYVRDLQSGRDKQLAVRGELSNLVWSSDSRKLYFSGNDTPNAIAPQRIHGSVCIVDMADVFRR
jgi:hypothetical protein